MMTNGHYKIINTYNIIKSGHRKNSYSVPYKDALDSCFSPILFTSVCVIINNTIKRHTKNMKQLKTKSSKRAEEAKTHYKNISQIQYKYTNTKVTHRIWRRCVGFHWKVFAQVSLLWLVFKIVTYNVYVCFEWV
jgi:Flp pilus assembly protein TadB